MEKHAKNGCSICSHPRFERNHYYFGKLLTARDFSDEQSYANQKRWLINRSIHGYGVVCGLEVDFTSGPDFPVTISAGLAIDCCGREILVCKEQTLHLKDKIDECEQRAQKEQRDKEDLLICLQYHECKSQPVPVQTAACDQEEQLEYNRIRDSFKITVKCASEIERQEQERETTTCQPEQPLHQQIYEALRSCPACDDHGCIILARLVYTDKPRIPENPPYELDACSDRKFVYNNALLYDLIETLWGETPEKPGRPPRIVDVSWKECHASYDRTIPWNKFRALVEAGLTVEFDQAMTAESINRHSFQFAITTVESGTGYLLKKLVPAQEIKYLSDKNGWRATFHADSNWIKDELTGANSEIARGIELVEITLRGSLISGTNKKALDGEFIGNKLPTGNGVQGGDFVSCFSVAARRSTYLKNS